MSEARENHLIDDWKENTRGEGLAEYSYYKGYTDALADEACKHMCDVIRAIDMNDILDNKIKEEYE